MTCFIVIAVTFYGRAHEWANVRVDGSSSVVTHISGTDTAAEVTLPNNTRLLAVFAEDRSDNDQSGFLIKLSNGFITGSHWKCTHSHPEYYWTLTYNDTDWQQAVVYSWQWGEHQLHPAEYISGEEYGGNHQVWCRGWVSKYIKHDY